jgi:predicted transcriptional regulator
MARKQEIVEEFDDLDEYVRERIADPDFAGALFDATLRSSLLAALVAHRQAMKMRQIDVAKAMGTTQSAISELEAGGTDPYLSTLQRYARAVCGQISVHFEVANPQLWADSYQPSDGPVDVLAA